MPDGICFVRPEVRQFELDLIAKAIDRYPDLAGIHIEEPGYNWGNDYCYCDYCRQFCQQELRHRHSQGPPGGQADASTAWRRSCVPTSSSACAR